MGKARAMRYEKSDEIIGAMMSKPMNHGNMRKDKTWTSKGFPVWIELRWIAR